MTAPETLLAPCPFISDGRAHGPSVKKNGFQNWNVECLCGAMGPDAANPEEAERLWSASRPTPTPIPEGCKIPECGKELHCQSCHRAYTVWFAPNPLWNRVVRNVIPPGAIEPFLCMDCFAIWAEEHGIKPTAWALTEESATPPVLTPYDQAVADLAPYLPDGWVAQDEDGDTVWYPEEPERGWGGDDTLWFTKERGGKMQRIEPMTLPKADDWRTSLRRVEKGKVVDRRKRLPHAAAETREQ